MVSFSCTLLVFGIITPYQGKDLSPLPCGFQPGFLYHEEVSNSDCSEVGQSFMWRDKEVSKQCQPLGDRKMMISCAAHKNVPRTVCVKPTYSTNRSLAGVSRFKLNPPAPTLF